MIRTILFTILATAILAAHGWAEEPGLSAPRYATPEKSPRFRNPQFISRPLRKAYPGIEYNIRPAIKGGTFPYIFTLEASPREMKVDATKGTVTWIAPKNDGMHTVAIKVRDAIGREATQEFSLTVSKSGFYFISPNGNDANSGSIEKPWKTVKRTAIPPDGFTYPNGAVVVFRGGGYKIDRPAAEGKTSSNSIPISAASPKIWLAYPGEKPVIDFGWSAEKQKIAHLEQQKSGKLLGGGRGPATHRGYGHRFALVGGSDYLYMDGFEIKNACYYMFVMWNGRNTVHFRRCDMHHLYCDGAENPGFIFTYSGSRKGGRKWGERAKVTAYKSFVIQDNHFHDRFMVGHHGAAFVWYTVHDAVIENNLFERLGGTAFWDKDNGFGNTYRGNIVREPGGDFGILSQGSSDEIEICYNYFEGTLKLWGHAGWTRNIWVHHNSFRGSVEFPWLTRHLPTKFDETQGDFSNVNTADTASEIRKFPQAKRFMHFYRNVLTPDPKNRRTGMTVVRIPRGNVFVKDWRYIRWDENLVDDKAMIGVVGRRREDYSLLKACGFDKHGVQAPVELDAEGRLPENSPYRGKFGR